MARIIAEASASAARMHDFVTPQPHGIHVIDTGFVRPRFDAAYLVAHGGRGAFIDTGTSFALPRLLAAIDDAGLTREAIDHVIVTHVHLDHAGGAGALMRELPHATLVAHARGARHMIDPAALLDGARGVYGAEEVERSYGEVPGVPAERVVATHDGMTLELAGRPLLFIDTPGHARHHHCIWDATSRSWFTGDTFGMAYPEFRCGERPWPLPTTTPVQFEPEALRASIERLLSYEPERVYVTHFGGVERPREVAHELLLQIDAMVAIARPLRDAPDRRERLERGFRALYRERARAFGCAMSDARLDELLDLDVGLNAAGVEVWLDRESRA
jgi:glyoxylase-like metal-dependent hydrolase (beta-lactamase superfamily II)